jgi:hypothetical protein
MVPLGEKKKQTNKQTNKHACISYAERDDFIIPLMMMMMMTSNDE